MKNFIKWLGQNKVHRHNLIIRLSLMLLLFGGLFYDLPSLGWSLVFGSIVLSFGIASFVMAWKKYKL